MRIGVKLMSGYFVLALCSGMAGYMGLRVTGEINREFDRVANDIIPDLRLLEQMKTGALRIVASTNEYGFIYRAHGSRGKVSSKGEDDLLQQGTAAIDEALARYRQLVEAEGGQEKALCAEISAASEAVKRTSAALIALIKDGATAAELLEQREQCEKAERAFLKTIDAALVEENKKFVVNRKKVETTIVNGKQSAFLFALATFVLAAAGGAFISGSLSRRISALQRAAERIGAGKLDETVPVSSADELGILAGGFNQMAAALRQSRNEIIRARNYLNDIIHSLVDSLIVVAADGAIQSVNVATCSLLGYDEEPAGLPFAKVCPDSPLDEVIARGIVSGVETSYITSDGSVIPVAFSGSVLWNEDNSVMGFVCLARDITERKRTEALLQRFNEELRTNNEEMRNFAYIVSHDLRAPLVNIKGFAGELKESLQELAGMKNRVSSSLPENDRVRLDEIMNTDVPEALHFIESSVNRMDSLIGCVLKLSRLGHRELKPEPVHAREVVDGILNALQHQLDQHRTEVRIGELPEVVVDKVSLEQIFGNLLDNAVKYLDPGRPGQLEIFGERSEEGVVFHIRDNGRGVPQEDMQKIFEIFRRSGNQDVAGEGMGLAYVKTLVKHLGGLIWCTSQPGAGSTFSFSIPARAAAE